MRKRNGGLVLALFMMLPCCFFVLPLVGFLISTYISAQQAAKRLGGVAIVGAPGITINGMPNTGYIFLACIVILFIAGMVVGLRSMNDREDSK